MHTTDLIWMSLRTSAVIGILLLLACVISIGLYDVRQIRRKRAQAQAQSNSGKHQPLVTILVPAYNESRVIKRSLDSIKSLTYKRIQVIIINDASKDWTGRVARKFLKQHPELKWRLVNLRRNRGKGGALNYALEKYVQGSLFMVLDADCTLKPDTVEHAVRYFDDPQVMGMAANVRVAEDPSALSYLQKIEYLIGYRHKKYYSITNSEFIIGGQGSVYRTQIVKQIGGFDERMLTEDIALSLAVAQKGNKTHRLVYASDVVTYTEAVPTIRSLYRQRYRWKFGAMQALFKHKQMILARTRKHSLLLTWFRIPQALFGEFLLLTEPLILLLFLSIALAAHNLMIFLGSWFTLTTYAIFTILVDEETSRRERRIMLALAPAMYPMFYLVTVLNVIAMIKCMQNWRQLLGHENVRGTWISPERVGKPSLS